MKIHYHTDCSFFAGCENMLLSFFNSKLIRENFSVSFSYRYSKKYEMGFNKRINPDFKVYKLKFLNIHEFDLLPIFIPFFLRRMIFFINRILFLYPIYFFEIFYFIFFLKKIKPDIIHINNGGYPGALSCRAIAFSAKFLKIKKIIMVINNIAVPYNSFFRILEWPIDFITVKCVSIFISGSEIAKNSIIKNIGANSNNCMSIHNGIKAIKNTKSKIDILNELDSEQFGGITIGVVGLLIPRKGHINFLKAIAILCKEVEHFSENVKVLFLGDGHLKEELLKFSHDNFNNNFIYFLGNKDDIGNYINALDILVLPSIENEDFPFVVLEAMSFSKPVIASKVAGTIEQIEHNFTGILVEPNRIDELAKAIIKLYLNIDDRIFFGSNGYKRYLSMFESEISIQKYYNLYNE
jgi:glycosyltransferase involved in cell wall biosynthesis